MNKVTVTKYEGVSWRVNISISKTNYLYFAVNRLMYYLYSVTQIFAYVLYTKLFVMLMALPFDRNIYIIVYF